MFVLFSNACAFYGIWATVMVCLGIYCTFEVGSDAGIISWRSSHELVQEVRRRQLWSCPAGGLYLLLTGAQSDITHGGGGGVGGNKYKEEEDLRNSRGWVFVHMRGSSGGGGGGNRIQLNEKQKYPAVDGEMRVKNDDWMACLSWQLTAYLFHIMSETYCGC